MADRLKDVLSPYLRQHADDPVDWWPWGPKALAEARRRDVPVFLSIGYAACHWCHVMAHVSFEDPEVAEILNAGFVPIKVDREERPDVDAIYMDVTVALTGHGGWPMSVWLTPDGHAFHAGTYYPSQPRHGVPSFRQVLDAVTQAWQERRDQVETGAPAITAEIAARTQVPSPRGLTRADADQSIGSLIAQIDETHGGFGGAPKFPPSTVLDALLARAGQRDGPVAEEAWRVTRLTLTAMARGGLYDQLGGGFARYAVDRAWVVPHFEKMLYDNALLLGVYARAGRQARARGEEGLAGLCQRVVEETVGWLQREMTTASGAFAASLDADSVPIDGGHAREGAFAVWTPAQLREVLGDDADAAATLFVVTEGGTFEDGASTLQLPQDAEDAVWFATVRERLNAARDRRPRPARDDKVVAAWNGWAIASLVDAAMLLDRPDWLDDAARAARAVTDTHLVERADGLRLARVSRDGVAGADGAAEDYAGLASALLALTGATGDAVWLTTALDLLDVLETRYGADDGGVFDAAPDPTLVRRPRDLAENATPNGSSAALRAARVAARITGEDRWRTRADALAATLAAAVMQAPRAAGWALADAVVEHGAREPVEVAVLADRTETGRPDTRAAALTRAAWQDAPPGSVVVAGAPGSSIPLLRDRGTVDGQPAAYVCRGQVCALPVSAVDALQRLMG